MEADIIVQEQTGSVIANRPNEVPVILNLAAFPGIVKKDGTIEAYGSLEVDKPMPKTKYKCSPEEIWEWKEE